MSDIGERKQISSDSIGRKTLSRNTWVAIEVVGPSEKKRGTAPRILSSLRHWFREKYKNVCFAMPAWDWPARASFTGPFFVDVGEHVALKDAAAFCVAACGLCPDSAQHPLHQSLRRREV